MSISTNERAEQIMGRRLSPEQEKRGVIPFDCPCELGYQCPVCQRPWDDGLAWSEYSGFLWCPTCNKDYPSALCVPVDGEPDPEKFWWNAGPDAAITVYLDTVRDAILRAGGSVGGAPDDGVVE